MAKIIEYSADDNTTALRALKSGVDCNGEMIPRAMRDRAIRILHRMPAFGELEYDFDNEGVWRGGWTATLHAQSAIVEAVKGRERAARPKPVYTSNRGPKAMSDMFRF